jgi:hypothetical protein
MTRILIGRKGGLSRIVSRAVFLLIAAAAAFGIMTLTSSDRGLAASPPGCTGNAPAASVSVESGNHYNGDTLHYVVSYSILPGSANCDITNADAFLYRPNRPPLQTLDDATISGGAVPEIITCPGDAQCVPHPDSDYEFVVDKPDITGPAKTCNSITGALTYNPPPPRLVVANTTLNGIAQRDPTDAATACAIASVPIIHPDVQVVKTGDTKVTVGGPAQFNITVTAIGDSPSTNVVLTDGGLDDTKVTVGGPDAGDCGPITGGVLTCTFGTLDPAGVAGPVSKTITLTHATTAEQCPAISNTAQVSADREETVFNNSSSWTILLNPCEDNPDIKKTPKAANLWLCSEILAPICTSGVDGIEERSFFVQLNDPITSISPKGEPQTIGSFEFEVRFDAKLVSVIVERGPIFERADAFCATTPGEGFVQFRCNIKGKPTDAPVGPGIFAVVRVRATADVYSMIIPHQDNGIVTQLINQDCALSDLQGHPIKTELCSDSWVTIRYLEGDVNADCVVDVRDQQEVAFRWGSVLGMLLYNSRLDLEPSAPKRGDGDIDAKDLQVIFGRHGSTCFEPHPPQPPINPTA